jgi:hypothetical protein
MESPSEAVRSRSAGSIRTKIRTQLCLLGLVLWTVTIVSVATPTAMMRTGQIKGTDFVHFYTLARLGAAHRADLFADAGAQRTIQLQAVPESKSDWFPPAYGPQVTVALTPLGWLNYPQALLAWLLFSTCTYLAVTAILVRRTQVLRSYEALALLAAASNPAFWTLFLHGQLSVVGLAIVAAAYVALRSGRETLAGACLGLLAYKPPLAVPIMAMLFLARAWRSLGAAAAVGGAQVLAAVPFVGLDGMITYWHLLLDSPRLATLLTAKPAQMHSLRAFWLLLLPGSTAGVALYAVCAAVAIAAGAVAWRRAENPSTRMAALLIAMVLAAPHLYVYDLVLLTPVWIWMTDWCLGEPALRQRFRWVLYLGFIAPILPTVTQTTLVQLSVVCLSIMLLFVWRRVPDTGGPPWTTWRMTPRSTA